MDIKVQAAIVTGGGSGLGAATARKLATMGAKVAVFDLNKINAESVAKEIGGIAIAGDVASEADAERALDTCVASIGTPRVLVNCAGIAVAKRVFGKDGRAPLSDFERIIRVNLIGSYNMVRVFGHAMSSLDALADGERGLIVSTASVAAFEGQIGQSAYAASKGGIAALTLPLAREFAQFGIRVLGVAPGLFLTPLLASLPEEAQASLAKAIPYPSRLGSPDEFGALVAHMVENRFLNGEVIRLDGALRMAPR